MIDAYPLNNRCFVKIRPEVFKDVCSKHLPDPALTCSKHGAVLSALRAPGFDMGSYNLINVNVRDLYRIGFRLSEGGANDWDLCEGMIQVPENCFALLMPVRVKFGTLVKQSVFNSVRGRTITGFMHAHNVRNMPDWRLRDTGTSPRVYLHHQTVKALDLPFTEFVYKHSSDISIEANDQIAHDAFNQLFEHCPSPVRRSELEPEQLIVPIDDFGDSLDPFGGLLDDTTKS